MNYSHKYPKFIFQKYTYKQNKNDFDILFNFQISPNIFFQPKVKIKNIDAKKLSQVPKKVLDNFVFHLGLIEMISYWKATCSPKIEIQAGYLDKNQIKWWEDLISKGLGEFFYKNKINFLKKNFIRFDIKSDKKGKRYNEKIKNNILVPIGGGKDSIVTLEILKREKKDIKLFSLNPTKTTKEVIKTSGLKNPIIVERQIDKKLLDLNQKGFLNGHTPFSAYLAFLTYLVSLIFDYKYIAVSNERSSNEGSAKYLGKTVNHQYSKSFDFEKKIRNYSKKYIAKDIEYFSFLRPFYEIQIARKFSNSPKYSQIFLSCNEAYKTKSGVKKQAKKWCVKCPKCLFVFVILYPFIKKKEIIKIFNKNLFEDKSLLPIVKELIGERKTKPFECIGTRKENLIAFYLSLKKVKKERESIPYLLSYFQDKILPKRANLEIESKKMLNGWDKNNNLPKKFEILLKKYAN